MSIMEHYFEWLCDRIGYDEFYDALLRFLFETEFVWVEPMDENRAKDGLWLRREFMDDEGVRGDPFENKEVSVLEVLVRLTYRLEEEVMGDPDMGLFWTMLGNLGLLETGNMDIWKEILDDWMYRRSIEYDGSGGLFPLKRPRDDQASIEIWGQAMNYLNEVLGYE